MPTKSDLYVLYSLLSQQGQVLSLRAHFIDKLPKCLDIIAKRILFLNLSFNRLESIALDFFKKCENLEVLALRNNPIKSIEFTENLKLVSLTMSFCKLEIIHPSIRYLKNLKK